MANTKGIPRFLASTHTVDKVPLVIVYVTRRARWQELQAREISCYKLSG